MSVWTDFRLIIFKPSKIHTEKQVQQPVHFSGSVFIDTPFIVVTIVFIVEVGSPYFNSALIQQQEQQKDATQQDQQGEESQQQKQKPRQGEADQQEIQSAEGKMTREDALRLLNAIHDEDHAKQLKELLQQHFRGSLDMENDW